MIWFLVGTGTLFFLLGNYTQAAVLSAALIPIAGMDAYQSSISLLREGRLRGRSRQTYV
jgi:hypothetical protein